MKILIVGSSGYVGSNLISLYSRESNNKIFGISRSVHSNEKLQFNFIGDVSNLEFVASINLEFDVIINCIANTGHFGLKNIFFRDNVLTVKNLLEAFDGKYKTFIHLSTEAVYLSGKLPILSEEIMLPKYNLSTYSWSKKLAEIFINQFKSAFNSKIIIIRPRLIWGGSNSGVLGKILNASKKNLFFYVDAGKYLSSSTHILNLYKGINCAIKYGKNKKTYFITDGDPIMFNELIKRIMGKQFKKDFPSLSRRLIYPLCLLCDLVNFLTFRFFKMPLSRSVYYLTFSEVIVDISLAKTELNFIPDSIGKINNEY